MVGVVAPRPTGIFAKLHIQNPMLLVFDAPVATDRGGEAVLIRERTQEVATFGADAFADDPRRLDAPDRLEPRLMGFGVQPVEVATEGIAPNLDAPRIFLDGFLDR